MNKWPVFVRFMRYVSAVIVTITFLFVLVEVSGLEGFDLTLAVCAFILIFISCCFITFPVAVFWIYSFVKSIRRRTPTDKRLLWVHIADLLMLVVIIILCNRPEPKCDADIMAEHYERYGDSMRKLIVDTKAILPDTASLHMEFENLKGISKSTCLNKYQSAKLRKQLKDVGCIGMDIYQQHLGKISYSALRFRRIGMGMYSFRLYDNALTLQEIDRLNNNECLIVYNDSTVFEFGGGAFGIQFFVGKEEFLIRQHNRISDENEADR